VGVVCCGQTGRCRAVEKVANDVAWNGAWREVNLWWQGSPTRVLSESSSIPLMHFLSWLCLTSFRVTNTISFAPAFLPDCTMSSATVIRWTSTTVSIHKVS